MGLIFKSTVQKRKSSERKFKKTFAALVHYQAVLQKKTFSESDRKIIKRRIRKLEREGEKTRDRIKELREREIREREKERREKQKTNEESG